MQITFFGYVWILFVFFAFFVTDIRFMILITLFSMVLQCNSVVILGSSSIGVQAFTVFVALIRIMLLPKCEKGIRHKSLPFFLILMLIYILINTIETHNLLKDNWISVLIISVYILFAITLFYKKISLHIDEQWIENAIDSIAIVVIAIGFLQYFAVAGASFIRPFLTTFVFNEITNMNVIFHGKPTYLAMYSTFMEPSYFSAFMVGMFSVISMRNKVSLKNVVLLLFIALSVLLSRSSTGYAGLAIVFAIQLVRFYGKKRIVRVLLPMAFFCVLFLLLFNYDLLDKVLFSKNTSSSYVVRSRWNERAWNAFLTSPWFGVGINQSRASSLIFTLLAEYGIVGFLLYASIFLKEAMLILKKNNSETVMGTVLAVLSICICQFIACPDLNFSPFWMMLFVQMISLNVQRNCRR